MNIYEYVYVYVYKVMQDLYHEQHAWGPKRILAEVRSCVAGESLSLRLGASVRQRAQYGLVKAYIP